MQIQARRGRPVPGIAPDDVDVHEVPVVAETAVAEPRRRVSIPGLDRRQTIKLAGLVVVIGLVFAGSLLLGAGGFGGINNAPREVEVGSFGFAYPGGWHRMHKADYPSKSGGVGLGEYGTVMLGICPSASVATSCAAQPGVLHMLFFESVELTTANGAVKALDKSLPRRFKQFKRTRADITDTASGTQAVRYEFTFRAGKQQLKEIVMLYPSADTGAITIVQGPVKEMKQRSRTIDEILASAREQM